MAWWQLYADDADREWSVPGVGVIHADARDGSVDIYVNVQAISGQAKGLAKASFRNVLRSLTQQVPFLITTDIQMEVCSLVSLRERYESDGLPDVDNILKPTIDALTGPEGVMVNDCQLQSVLSYWVTTCKSHDLHIKIQSFDAFTKPKKSLIFVEVMRALYLPFSDEMPPEINLNLLEGLIEQFDGRAELEERGFDYSLIYSMMPQQRLFHRTRVREFRRMTATDYRLHIMSKLAPRAGSSVEV